MQEAKLTLSCNSVRALSELPGDELKALIVALCDLAEYGAAQAPKGAAGIAYRLLAAQVDSDAAASRRRSAVSAKRRDAARARWQAHGKTSCAGDDIEEMHNSFMQSDAKHMQNNANGNLHMQNPPPFSPPLPPPTTPSITPPIIPPTEIGPAAAGKRARAREARTGSDPLTAYLADNLLPMSPGNWAALSEIMSQGIAADLVRYAVDIAMGNGARTWAYVQSILNRWLIQGIMTIDQAKQEHERGAGRRLIKGMGSGPGSASAAFAALADKYAEGDGQDDKTGDGAAFAAYLGGLAQMPLGEL